MQNADHITFAKATGPTGKGSVDMEKDAADTDDPTVGNGHVVEKGLGFNESSHRLPPLDENRKKQVKPQESFLALIPLLPVTMMHSLCFGVLLVTAPLYIKFTGWTLLWLAYQSTGVIYGDIGTSPLYVYSSTFSSAPSKDDLLGALSLIIWTLTLMVAVKYVCIVLHADDDGEGGTFALYSLLSRYARLQPTDPKDRSLLLLDRYLSTDMKPTNRTIRQIIEGSKVLKSVIRVVGIAGVALIIADGVLTPAQSVLGAIQGLEVVKPDIGQPTITGASCAILIVLFLAQPFGITKIASTFAPVVIIWLTFNLSFGIYNLVWNDWTVLKAFSPYFAGQWFVRNGTEGWKQLGGILLAFTGVEAMFADLGAFSCRAVQLSWLCFAFPCLLISYIGQAAYISVTPEAYSNPFFNTVPPGMLYPSLVIAILAAVVASEATILSTYQIVSQIIRLSYFPPISVHHTSKKFFGQIYIPIANWLMMIGTVIITAVYTNTTALGNAYGTCVVLVTFITTSMVSVVALIVWRLHWLIVLPCFLVFACLDGLYLSSALTKVPSGAWFTLALAFILSCIISLWRYGKEQQWKAERKDLISISRVVRKSEKSDDGSLYLTDAYGGNEIMKTKGVGIYLDKVGEDTPLAFQDFVTKFGSCTNVGIFYHVRQLPIPTIPAEDRWYISRTSVPNYYRVIFRHGYADPANSDLSTSLLDELVKFTLSEEPAPRTSAISMPAVEQRRTSKDSQLQLLKESFKTQIVYVSGSQEISIRPQSNIVRKALLGTFLKIRDVTKTRLGWLQIPDEKLVQIGSFKEI